MMTFSSKTPPATAWSSSLHVLSPPFSICHEHLNTLAWRRGRQRLWPATRPAIAKSEKTAPNGKTAGGIAKTAFPPPLVSDPLAVLPRDRRDAPHSFPPSRLLPSRGSRQRATLGIEMRRMGREQVRSVEETVIVDPAFAPCATATTPTTTSGIITCTTRQSSMTGNELASRHKVTQRDTHMCSLTAPSRSVHHYQKSVPSSLLPFHITQGTPTTSP